MEPELLDFRVTIRRDGIVRLVDWGPRLTTGGPLNTLLQARGGAGVCIADLTVLRGPREGGARTRADRRARDPLRAEEDADAWIAEDIDVLSRAALAPAPATPMDDLDRLFLDGPGA